jgi:hypothetical protein
MGVELEGIWKETLVACSFYSFDIMLERLNEITKIVRTVDVLADIRTRHALRRFSYGVHLHNIPCSSVSQTGFRKGVSGVPRDENA